MRGIVIAGTHSGCGKTTMTLGILAALMRKGLKVQSFKTGPDFIDSGLHRMITGRPSRNLDLWMCGEDYVRGCYAGNSADCDVSVVEGVMGLFDGAFSTASLAAALGLSVVLVVDAYGMAETAGAVVHGMKSWASGGSGAHGRIPVAHPSFAGVVFNRVASENHFQRLTEGVKDLPVLGYLPRDLQFEIPHRHLGLATAEESPLSEENIGRLADAVLKHIDLERMLAAAAAVSIPAAAGFAGGKGAHRPSAGIPPVRIAMAYDRAFCFYYEDNLDLLRREGAELIRFSPLSDAGLPDGMSAVYLGGGYPELHAAELSGNLSMLRSLHAWAEAGRPLYAECGGLMYLSQGIHDFDGRFFPMAAVLPFETGMKKGRSRLGYRQVVLKEDCIIGKKGDELRGHEFHYSEIVSQTGGDAPGRTVYSRYNGSGEVLPDEGYCRGNTLASYIHLHFGSNPGIAAGLINSCRKGR